MSDMEQYGGTVDDAALVEMLLENGDLSREAALALISHVHRTMDSAYRSIIVLVYGRAWLSLGMTGPLELIDRVLNGRALKLSMAERKQIIRLLDATGLTREQIAKAIGMEPRPSSSHKGPVPGKVPKAITPRIREGRQTGESWLRPTKAPFTVGERRQIEARLADLITPSSRASTIRSLTAAAGHLSAAAGVEHPDDLTAQLLLQAASLKGVLMDEALEACYLPPELPGGPTREARALDALARWYIAWLAASSK